MIKLLTENPISEFKEFLDAEKKSKDVSVDSLINLARIKVPQYFRSIYSMTPKSLEGFDSSKVLVESDRGLGFVQTLLELNQLIKDFWMDRCRSSQEYYKNENVFYTYSDHTHYCNVLESYYKEDSFNIFDINNYPNTELEVLVYMSNLMNDIVRTIEADGLAAVKDVILSNTINEHPEESYPVIFTNFSQRQLGLLTKVLSETKGNGYGFANLKKSQIDDLFSRVLYTDSGKIGDPKKLNKVTFGSTEDITKDMAVLNRYFIALQTKLQKLSKK